jgi:hypothetical protein
MKKAIVQFVESHKFLLDTIYNKFTDIDIYGININQNLYKNVFHIKPEYIFFSGYNITEEIVSFLNDYALKSSKIKIYICWIDSESYLNLDNKYNVTHIVPECTNKKSSQHKVIYYPNNLLNSRLYYRPPSDKIKENSIIGFLDTIKELPEDIISNLYPNKKLPIKLFNNPNIQTIHNLGIITEPEKAELLRNNKYYLNVSDHYALEANACGCIILNSDDLPNFQNIDFKNNMSYIDHNQFLQQNIFI